jgi:hypothetical protein
VTPRFSDRLVRQLAAFVRARGIRVEAENLPRETFLPGLDIIGGTLRVNEARLLFPGDILHEAGHIAVTSPDERDSFNFSATPGEEMAAIAWSYAAAVALGIAPEIVFHPMGYKGGAAALLENFAAGRYIGVPLLQCWGMSVEPRNAQARALAPFPHMLQWLRR